MWRSGVGREADEEYGERHRRGALVVRLAENVLRHAAVGEAGDGIVVGAHIHAQVVCSDG